MAARIRNESWIEDEELKEVMKKYVSQGLRREDIMVYLERDFSQYAWSFRTLDRRLRAFGICYTDKRVSLEEVKDAVRKKLDGPGKLLGYRAMQNRLRQGHDLLVPCDLVHAVMFDLNEEGLAARCPIRKKGSLTKQIFRETEFNGFGNSRPPHSTQVKLIQINNLGGLDNLSQFQHLRNGNTFWSYRFMHNRFLRTGNRECFSLDFCVGHTVFILSLSGTSLFHLGRNRAFFHI